MSWKNQSRKEGGRKQTRDREETGKEGQRERREEREGRDRRVWPPKREFP